MKQSGFTWKILRITRRLVVDFISNFRTFIAIKAKICNCHNSRVWCESTLQGLYIRSANRNICVWEIALANWNFTDSKAIFTWQICLKYSMDLSKQICVFNLCVEFIISLLLLYSKDKHIIDVFKYYIIVIYAWIMFFRSSKKYSNSWSCHPQ